MLVLQTLILMLKKILSTITQSAHLWMQILLDRIKIVSYSNNRIQPILIGPNKLIVLGYLLLRETQVI